VSDYEKLGGLELRIDGLELEQRRLSLASFTRVTTTIVLSGEGERGEGEDVTYAADEHESFPRPDLAGTWTLDDLSQRLDPLGLQDYRRWAFESAALDLALRQNGLSLGAAVGREYRPVRFVASTREDIQRYLEKQPSLEFEGLPDAVIEDAAFTDETRPILLEAADRLSFDAPIHSVGDVEALEIEPRWLNVKPSRFGPLRRLFETLAYAERHGIRLYGGGQFELGPGRSHIQALASLYYADTPNDVAPSVYNEPELPDGLPASPLPAPAAPRGLSFAA